MKRKVLHLENKETGEHKYYGNLKYMCNQNPGLPYHTLKPLKTEAFPWHNDTFIIRLGALQTPEASSTLKK